MKGYIMQRLSIFGVLAFLVLPLSAQDTRLKPGATQPADPAWLKSLPLRGEPVAVKGEGLNNMSMPINGIGTRNFSLGGDGLLCEAHPGGVPRNVVVDQFFPGPLTKERNDPKPRGAPPMEVVLAVKTGDSWKAKPLRANEFNRAYPIGCWSFPALDGVEVKLKDSAR